MLTTVRRVFVCLAAASLVATVHAQSCADGTVTFAVPQGSYPSASASIPRRASRVPAPATVLNVNCTTTTSVPAAYSPVRASLTSFIDENSSAPTQAIVWPHLSNVAWPFIALVVLLFVGPRRLRALIARLGRFRGVGIEVEFNPEAAEKVRGSVSGTIGDFIRVADRAYARHAVAFAVRNHLGLALARALPTITAGSPREYRATVHVPDVVYADYMYQLLNYFPSGGGAARRFSQRRGILGKVWRLDKSIGVGDVIAYDRPRGNSDPEQALVSEWSMTREEVRGWHHKPRKSFLCVVLRIPYEQSGQEQVVPGRQVGVFYIDSRDENAFGNNDQACELAMELERAPQVIALARAVELAMHEMRKSNLDLKIEHE
jgi:hypothetical protein